MKHYNKSLVITLTVLFVLSIFIYYGCRGNNDNSDNRGDQAISIKDTLPLNISVYLDLSDRLTRDLTPTQMERDTAIINHLVDLFIEDCISNGKIINSQNHFQIFFYPSPNSSQISLLARGLNVDMSKTPIKQKKIELRDMKERFQSNLSQIYDETLKQQDWVGSDIWGFFSNKEVDKLCIRNGYRNILIILTDGYIFHAKNKINQGSAYSYILPQNLTDPNSSLLVNRTDLSNLEILMLEINPYDPKQRNPLVSTLENWFKAMGVEKFVVSETALPVNTEVYIDSFIND